MEALVRYRLSGLRNGIEVYELISLKLCFCIPDLPIRVEQEVEREILFQRVFDSDPIAIEFSAGDVKGALSVRIDSSWFRWVGDDTERKWWRGTYYSNGIK